METSCRCFSKGITLQFSVICFCFAPTLCFLPLSVPWPPGALTVRTRQASLRLVGSPAVGGEAFLRCEGADVFIHISAVKQVTVQAFSRPPQILLNHRHRAVRQRAAGVQTVPPGEHRLRSQQEGGSLLDGGLRPDDALLRGAEVAHAGVAYVGRSVSLVLLELLSEFLQKLFHSGYFRFQV